jgi:conjugative transfer signal peptidase TraF
MSRRVALAAWGLTGLLLAVTPLADTIGVRVNTSASLPPGIWQLTRAGGPLQRGEIVSLCPVDSAPFRLARQRGYIPGGRCPGGYEPLYKPIAAVAGDVVTMTATGIAVNGRLLPNSRALARDNHGELPVMPAGHYPVAPGTIWLVSSFNPASFDSRYVGPLPVTHVQGRLRPLWIRGLP